MSLNILPQLETGCLFWGEEEYETWQLHVLGISPRGPSLNCQFSDHRATTSPHNQSESSTDNYVAEFACPNSYRLQCIPHMQIVWTCNSCHAGCYSTQQAANECCDLALWILCWPQSQLGCCEQVILSWSHRKLIWMYTESGWIEFAESFVTN